jgi:hypothetical protein
MYGDEATGPYISAYKKGQMVDGAADAAVRRPCKTSWPMSGPARSPSRRVGSLAQLLKNRFYIGEVAYRGEVHRGEHEPILTHELFAAVQAEIAANAVARQIRLRGSAAILAGRLFDDRGNRMSPTHARPGRGNGLAAAHDSSRGDGTSQAGLCDRADPPRKAGIALSDRRRSGRPEPMAKSAMKRQPAKTPAAIDLDAGRPANLGTERDWGFQAVPKI